MLLLFDLGLRVSDHEFIEYAIDIAKLTEAVPLKQIRWQEHRNEINKSYLRPFLPRFKLIGKRRRDSAEEHAIFCIH